MCIRPAQLLGLAFSLCLAPDIAPGQTAKKKASTNGRFSNLDPETRRFYETGFRELRVRGRVAVWERDPSKPEDPP